METTCGERFSLELKRLKKTTKEVSEYIGVSEYHIRQLLSPDDENWYYYVNDYVLNKLKELGFDIDFLLYEVIPNCYKIKSIAIRLKQERKRKKISLQDIEKKTFIGHSRLSRIENNLVFKEVSRFFLAIFFFFSLPILFMSILLPCCLWKFIDEKYDEFIDMKKDEENNQ